MLLLRTTFYLLAACVKSKELVVDAEEQEKVTTIHAELL